MSCHTWPLTSLWDQQINSFMELFKTVSYCQCLYRQHRGIQRIMYGDSKYHVLVFLQISCHIWCLISLLHFMSAFLSSRSQNALFFLDYKDLKVFKRSKENKVNIYMYKNKYCLLKSKYCPLSELPWERFALWVLRLV